MTDIQLLADKVSQSILAIMQDPDELWALKDVAEHIKISQSTAQQSIICDPDFPTPVYPGKKKDGRMGKPRWYAAEVKRFVRNKRG